MSHNTICKQRWALLAAVAAVAALTLAPSALAAGHGRDGLRLQRQRDQRRSQRWCCPSDGRRGLRPRNRLRPRERRIPLHQRRMNGPLKRLSRRAGRALGHGPAPGEHDLHVHLGGGRAKPATTDENTVVLRSRLLPGRRRHRRVLHREADRLPGRLRPEHFRRPERLDPGGRLRLGDRAL